MCEMEPLDHFLPGGSSEGKLLQGRELEATLCRGVGLAQGHTGRKGPWEPAPAQVSWTLQTQANM